MKELDIRIINCTNKKQPLKSSLSINESGFLCFSENSSKFAANALELGNTEDKIRIQLKHTLVAIQTMHQSPSYLYDNVLKELPMLFQTFNERFENIETRDQLIIKNNLYVVKFTGIKGAYRLNQVY